MSTFVNHVENALDQLPAAKKFANTRGFAVAKYYKGWWFGFAVQMLLYFSWLIGITFLGIVTASMWIEWKVLSSYAAWLLSVGFGTLMIWPLFVSHWDLKAHQKCLTVTNARWTAKDIVETIQLCAKSGATNDQLFVLQSLAKDDSVPANWWQWVDQKARQVIHVAQIQSNEQIAHKKEMEENTSAQQKIDQGTILS